jgi:chromosome segregation ATPase
MIIGLNISLSADVQVSISGYGNDKISISTDDRGNRDYIYIDKNSRVVNSTIGTSISINNRHMNKEEKIEFQKKKINRYQDKIYRYRDKIDKYEEKIIDKPKNRDRYKSKIDGYLKKIDEYKRKIDESRMKIAQYQK